MAAHPVQALAAQARAFSTQTEIAVVSGLPPLDVGRKVSERSSLPRRWVIECSLCAVAASCACS